MSPRQKRLLLWVLLILFVTVAARQLRGIKWNHNDQHHIERVHEHRVEREHRVHHRHSEAGVEVEVEVTVSREG